MVTTTFYCDRASVERICVQRPAVVLDDVSFVCLMDIVLRVHCHGISRGRSTIFISTMYDFVQVAEDKGVELNTLKTLKCYTVFIRTQSCQSVL